MTGRCHSEYSKIKIGLASRGRIPWNKGRHCVTDEVKQKISRANKGKKKPPRTAEHCKKLSENHRGGTIAGCTFTEEHKRHISEALKGKYVGVLRRPRPPFTLEHRKKLGDWQRGSKNHNWKGGITDTKDKIRLSETYKLWRQKVFIRDNFTCQDCGDNKGGNLQAHHIKPFSMLLQEIKEYMPLFNLFDAAMLYAPMWDINNGKTLCKECHHLNQR